MTKRMPSTGTLHYYCDDASLYDSAGHRMRHHGLRMLMASDDLYNSSSVLFVDGHWHEALNGHLLNGRLLNGHLLNGHLLNGRLLKGGGGGDREDVTFCKGDDSLCEIPGEVCQMMATDGH